MTKYFRLDIDEAESSKKELLESEMHVLNSLKAFQTYKKYRKSELVLKTSLRTKMRKMIAQINKIKEDLPVQEATKLDLPIKRKKGKIEDELDEIKRKLAQIR